MTQAPSLTKWHTYPQQRSALSNSSLFLEMQQLLGPVELKDPPNAPAAMSLQPAKKE